jgi:PKD repeat protein
MSASRRAAVTAAALVVLAVAARAEGPAIDHSEIKCLVAGKYRKMPAKFSPAEVAQPRVYFRPEGVPSWYYVEMKPEAPLGHVGVLPRPTKKLIKKHIEYYVEAASRDFDTGRTPEYAPIVVAKDSECDRDPLVPLYSKNPPAAVFPALPDGFALGGSAGVGTAALVVGGGAAVAGGVILATKDDEPPPSTAATTTSTTLVPVTTTTTQPPGRLALACQADARVGPIPFTVKFNAHAIGGTGFFDFVWDFGDGATSTQINPSHTFTVPGVYNVTVRATSGEIVDACARTITALPVSADLDVRVIGAGSVSAAGIACPGDCLETYPSGANITLTATPSAGALFVDWGGDCSGATPTCQVTMDRARSVTARFQAAPPTTFPLTVSFGGTGTGTVSGLTCTAPCTATYNAGTPVTLTATPTGGSTFGQWTGACTGPNPCNILMSGPMTATAIFNPPPTFTLNVTPSGGSGTGSVSGNGIVCPTNCTATYAAGTPVTLTAAAAAGSAFSGWTGDCAAFTGPTCDLTMSANRTAGANFTLTVATLTLTVIQDTGSLGGVDVFPPGKFACNGGPPPTGNTCTLNYTPGTTVTLTPFAETGSFLFWGGDCAAALLGTSPCVLVMSSNRSATANFGVATVNDALAARSTVVSRLEAVGARLAATLNGVPLAPPPPGQSVWTIEPRAGDNHLEAVAADGVVGTWRVDLAGVRGLTRGTLRVLAGEVVSVGPDAVVFRLKGRAGERFGLAFDVR